ncbi:ANTAR domain-containing protein [Krasilnikovia sp. MM14-A1004]|uniref:ANTAR domain-containing protein n=1 Tax=Krasilnikovia sp. MM14-A1004 TaxID=3373541 RepID=UPI00399C4F33
MADAEGQTAPPNRSVPSEEQDRRADLWEAGADERERLADERERLADEREALADERETLADRHDQVLDRRETAWLAHASSTGDLDDAAEAAATRAALGRAEAAVRRAEAELLRARQTAARVHAGATRRTATRERAAAAQQAEGAADAEEGAWLADRRNFVAAERDNRADTRDELADQREEAAGLRERLADDRERDSLDRERRVEHARRSGPRMDAARLPDATDESTHADRRAGDARQRERAAASRHAAADDRARAAAAWGPQAYGPMLVASFAQLARQLFGSDDLSEVLPQVLKFTVDAVAGCDSASITLCRHGQVVDQVATTPAAAELDEIQFATGIGPAPEAMNAEHAVTAPGLAESSRWPVLAATAAQLGAASALSQGLFVHRRVQWSALGAFTLYSASPDAFSDEDQEFTAILAAYLSVTVAMAHRRDEVDRREAALHRGLSTRDVIGQAKGILMERQHLSAGAAFDLLRRVSQRLNRKLADVAHHLAETGEIPS